jgi:transposase
LAGISRLVADGESVAGVPAKLPARARVFATGQGRKTDATDAHSVAVVALRTQGLQVVAAEGATVALRLLADRRDGLGHARTGTVNRLHRLLPGIAARRGEEVPVRPAGPRPGGNRAAA